MKVKAGITGNFSVLLGKDDSGCNLEAEGKLEVWFLALGTFYLCPMMFSLGAENTESCMGLSHFSVVGWIIPFPRVHVLI